MTLPCTFVGCQLPLRLAQVPFRGPFLEQLDKVISESGLCSGSVSLLRSSIFYFALLITEKTPFEAYQSHGDRDSRGFAEDSGGDAS
jgi:hypothetical protein